MIVKSLDGFHVCPCSLAVMSGSAGARSGICAEDTPGTAGARAARSRATSSCCSAGSILREVRGVGAHVSPGDGHGPGMVTAEPAGRTALSPASWTLPKTGQGAETVGSG
jgi:hypothetical protein